jgi:RimJ/RimL family protein N-acetyltransferase
MGHNVPMRQPVGEPVTPTSQVPLSRVRLEGEKVRLRPPDPRSDTATLYPQTHGTKDGETVWTYMGYGPFSDPGAMSDWVAATTRSADPLWYTVTDGEDRALGMVAMMNADPVNRRLELGNIWYVPRAHRTGVNTETAYLMLRAAFGTFHCRRVEWKCDSLNAPSRHAALRLGFTFEGVFRNHMIVKGRNRDTAWYAMTDRDWPAVRRTLDEWLAHPDPKPSLVTTTSRG